MTERLVMEMKEWVEEECNKWIKNEGGRQRWAEGRGCKMGMKWGR